MSHSPVSDFVDGRGAGGRVRHARAPSAQEGTVRKRAPASGRTKPIRVLVVEQQNLVRAGMCALLRKLGGVSVVGEAGTGTEAVEQVKVMRPDVVLMGIDLPDLSGIEATRLLAQEAPAARVLILSSHSGEEYVRKSFEVGAVGYILKDALTEELELALHAVKRGDKYLGAALTRRVVDEYASHHAEHLTARQLEVLRLVGEGRSRTEIAARLGVSVKTVETHRADVMHRLGAHDGAALVRWAMRLGLVPSEP
jgi:DNA-binding NarL/FixJ family response regulator